MRASATVHAGRPWPADATAPGRRGRDAHRFRHSASSTGKGTARRHWQFYGALLRLTRPRQWLKNLLVLAAPAAAGALFAPGVVWRVALALGAFCLASGGLYALNDAQDAAADREHPVKRTRPVAAGDISPSVARMFGAALILAAFALSAGLPVAFNWSLALYVTLVLAYSRWLKLIAVVDLVVIASGFVIRAVAGGFATGLPLSTWFIIVASFGALFIVAGKRSSELVRLGPDGGRHRATLELYTAAYLQQVVGMACAVTTVAYCLWALEGAQVTGASELLLAISIAPFVLALLRYTLLVFTGRGGEPEEIFLRDRPLQCVVLVWATLIGTGIYIA